MAIKCNNCGGEMRYNVQTGYLECDYCMEKILATEYGEVNDNATEIQEEYVQTEMESSVYQCPECGAEVRCFEEAGTLFCQYCGKQTFLKQRENSLRPKSIIPFKKSQTDLKKKYEDYVKSKWYVPSEISNPEHIKEFRGVYIPCWNFTYETKGNFSYGGLRTYYSGGYDYRETYAIDARTEGDITDITFDASEAFDDTISSAIAPFDIDKAEPFQEAYCAGFHIDKENVPEHLYEKMAEKAIADTVKETVEDSEKGSKKINITNVEAEPTYIKKRTDLTLIPVWFMTHRNKDRVSYSVANGQTGKMMMDLPVDKFKFFKGTGIWSLILSVIFVILFSTVLHSVTAVTVSMISNFVLFLSSWLLCREMKMIYNRDNAIYNLGSKKNTGEIPQKKQLDAKKASKIGMWIVLGFVFFPFSSFILSILSMSNMNRPSLLTIILTIVLLVFQGIRIGKLNKWKTSNEQLLGILTLAILIISLGVYFTFSPNDMYYYILSGVNVIGIVINALGCIKGFDYLTSRPVPNFYEREVTHGETKYN